MRNIHYFWIVILMFFVTSCVDKEDSFIPIIDPVEEEDPIQNPDKPITLEKKWERNQMPNGLSKGSLQGAAMTLGNMYQFRNATIEGEHILTYDVYNTYTKSWSIGAHTISCVPESHAGSACFAPEVVNSYYVGSQVFYCTLPFIYLSGHYEVPIEGKLTKREVIDVVDIENDRLVTRFTFPNRTDDVIAAYDFENNHIWIIGYQSKVTDLSPYVMDEYEIELTSLEPQKTDFGLDDALATVTIGGPNESGFQQTLESGTVQDACFANGYIYIAVGRGSSWMRTEWVKIHEYDTYSQKIVHTTICPDSSEPEGLSYENGSFYLTTLDKNLWNLSDSEVSDPLYNFEPAYEASPDSYEISNASQLIWFLGQVYSGRSYLKGKLTSDIDMSGFTDPFTYYIYDTNIVDGVGTAGRKYESHYAFRGEFDGQSHLISNFTINATPYDNCGLFPYVVDATIRNMNVNGKIRLTKSDHNPAESYDVQNVGLIGYMNGGILENINVTKLQIETNNLANSRNINRLVGSENGTITITNCKAE